MKNDFKAIKLEPIEPIEPIETIETGHKKVSEELLHDPEADEVHDQAVIFEQINEFEEQTGIDLSDLE